MTGSDDDKTRLLKDLAVSDFHFARRFPLPDRYSLTLDTADVGGGKQSRKGITGVNPMISGLSQLEYFNEALDAIQTSFDTRALGKNGSKTEMPTVNRKNLLSVVTNVNVDNNGKQVPLLEGDPRRNAPPSTVANLWMFHDEKSKAIYALSGRGYMVHGSDSDKTRILKALAPYDFPMAMAMPIAATVSSDSKYAKTMFDDVLRGIENKIPTAIGLDGKMKNPVKISASQLTLNATRITERSSNLGDAAPIQLIEADRPAPAKVQTIESSCPNSEKKSFFQRLFGR